MAWASPASEPHWCRVVFYECARGQALSPSAYFFGCHRPGLLLTVPAVRGGLVDGSFLSVPHSLLLLLGTEQGHAPRAVGVDAVVPDRVALHERAVDATESD